jgi:hypothetical protein
MEPRTDRRQAGRSSGHRHDGPRDQGAGTRSPVDWESRSSDRAPRARRGGASECPIEHRAHIETGHTVRAPSRNLMRGVPASPHFGCGATRGLDRRGSGRPELLDGFPPAVRSRERRGIISSAANGRNEELSRGGCPDGSKASAGRPAAGWRSWARRRPRPALRELACPRGAAGDRALRRGGRPRRLGVSPTPSRRSDGLLLCGVRAGLLWRGAAPRAAALARATLPARPFRRCSARVLAGRGTGGRGGLPTGS